MKISELTLSSKVAGPTLGQLPPLSKVSFPEDKTIVDLFLEQAAKVPFHSAIISEGVHWTYEGLNRFTSSLAIHLSEKNLPPNSVVSFLLDPSPDLIGTIFGIWRAGYAFLPIDPQWPFQRICQVLQESESCILVTTDFYRSQASLFQRQVPSLGSIVELQTLQVKRKKEFNTDSEFNLSAPHEVSYLLYTSGTTGKPKGVLVNHKNLTHYIHWAQKTYIGDSAIGNMPFFTSPTFDLTMTSLFLPLISGKTVHIFPKAEIDVILRNCFSNPQIDLVKLTPSHIEILRELELSRTSVRKVIAGGEELRMEHVQYLHQLNSDIEVYNEYGPTEATVGCAFRHVKPTDLLVTLGKPIDNTEILILNESLGLQPPGERGELCIGGEGLAMGYWKDPKETAEKFVQHPFRKNCRIYRTGDLALINSQGELIYHGRMDHQVKIRGFRVELLEIEAVLRVLPGVKDSVVVLHPKLPNHQKLYAFVIGSSLDEEQLIYNLKDRLPSHAIPHRILKISRIPINSNGKVDRTALIQRLESYIPKTETSDFQLDLQTSLEKGLAEIWSEVLKLPMEQFHQKSHFFRLGGDSLRATQVASRMEKRFQIDFSLKRIFQNPLLEELAQSVESAKKCLFQPIQRISREIEVPLSLGQTQIWIASQTAEGSIAHHSGGVFQLNSKLNPSNLEDAVNRLVDRHEILRTRFIEREECIIQEVLDPFVSHISKDFCLFIERASPTDQFDSDVPGHLSLSKQKIKEKLNLFFSRPFDLKNPPLFRILALELSTDSFLIAFCIHHILSDAPSVQILIQEFFQFYSHLDWSPLPLRIHYRDFTYWQYNQLKKQSKSESLDFWRSHLGTGQDSPLQISPDGPRSKVRRFKGDQINFQWNIQRFNEVIKKKDQGRNGSLFASLLTMISTLIHRIGSQENQETIVLGFPHSGRHHPDLDQQIGFYANLVPIKIFSKLDSKWVDQLLSVQSQLNDVLEHSSLPFATLLDELQFQRSVGRHPVFDWLVSLQDSPALPPSFQEMQREDQLFDDSTSLFGSKFDISFLFTRTDEKPAQLNCRIEYRSDMYSKQTVESWVMLLSTLFESVQTNPECLISELELLPETEKKRLLSLGWNKQVQVSETETFLDLWTRNLQEQPQSIAVTGVYEDESKKHLTYLEVEKLSCRISRQIYSSYQSVSKELSKRPRIILFMDRTERVVPCIFGILRSHATYVPVDTQLPPRRVKELIKSSEPTLVLTEAKWASIFSTLYFSEIPTLLWEEITQTTGDSGILKDLSDFPVSSSEYAYLLHTSGSTGNSNSVVVSHNNLVSMIESTRDFLSLKPNGNKNSWLVSHALSFDTSIAEIFVPLGTGGRTVIIPMSISRNPERLHRVFVEEKISFSIQSPGVMPYFIEEALRFPNRPLSPSLKGILLGGEKLDPSLFRDWAKVYPLNEVLLYNSYGPTEATVMNSYHLLTEEDVYPPIPTHCPLGRAMPGNHLYVLDSRCRPVPMGTQGELFIGGAQISQGYWLGKKPNYALNAIRFPDNPFSSSSGKLYRTGDLARWKSDGSLEFLGRSDSQVKIRGYRIELEEITRAMCNIEYVRDATVIAHDLTSSWDPSVKVSQGDLGMIAYWSRKVDFYPNLGSSQTIEAQLKEILPIHMIPQFILELKELPLTLNQKVDRRALPDPRRQDISVVQSIDFQPPREERKNEKVLGQIWHEVLGQDSSSLAQSFFEAGGSSLKALRLLSLIRNKMDTSIPFSVFYNEPTKMALLSFIEKAQSHSSELFHRGEGNPVLQGGVGPLRTEGRSSNSVPTFQHPDFQVRGDPWTLLREGSAEDPFFFLFPPGAGYSFIYRDLAQKLTGYRVYGIHFVNQPHVMIVPFYVKLIQDLRASRNINSPCFLGGYSSGGNLAFQVTAELERQGRIVSRVILVDSDRRLKKESFDLAEKRSEIEKKLKLDRMHKFIDSPEIYERILEAASNYLNYHLDQVDDVIIQTPIADLRSVSTSPSIWKNATSGAFYTDFLQGSHDDYFEPQYLDQTTNKILNALG